MNANKGYSGWSMSNRAVEAYENGEMPKSKWTKAAMLNEIAAYAAEIDANVSENVGKYLEKTTRNELFRRFFWNSSWHHTSKFFNATEFYALDEDAVEKFFENPTAYTYTIAYRLGNHEVPCRKTFKTEVQAAKYLKRRGFFETTYSFIRKNFSAYIEIDESAIN